MLYICHGPSTSPHTPGHLEYIASSHAPHIAAAAQSCIYTEWHHRQRAFMLTAMARVRHGLSRAFLSEREVEEERTWDISNDIYAEEAWQREPAFSISLLYIDERWGDETGWWDADDAFPFQAYIYFSIAFSSPCISAFISAFFSFYIWGEAEPYTQHMAASLLQLLSLSSIF